MVKRCCVCHFADALPDLLFPFPFSLKYLKAWVGHPYCDSIDNSTDFEQKVRRVIEVVCKRLGNRLDVDVDDRLTAKSKKRKFLVKGLPPEDVKIDFSFFLSLFPLLSPSSRFSLPPSNKLLSFLNLLKLV